MWHINRLTAINEARCTEAVSCVSICYRAWQAYDGRCCRDIDLVEGSPSPAVSGCHSWIADGVWPSGVQHAVEDRHTNRRFRALAGQAARAQARSDDALVSGPSPSRQASAGRTLCPFAQFSFRNSHNLCSCRLRQPALPALAWNGALNVLARIACKKATIHNLSFQNIDFAKHACVIKTQHRLHSSISGEKRVTLLARQMSACIRLGKCNLVVMLMNINTVHTQLVW
jgi:hypothetical protein